jgi:hypothetical protein
MSVLVAAARFYGVLHGLHFLVHFAALSFVMLVFGTPLIIRSIIRMRHYDLPIREIKV